MNRREAVQFMHDRHPKVIGAPGADVDLEALHLEFFWLQGHVCDLLDRRSDRAARRCFATMHEILVRGDSEVRPAVWNHFVIPHLVSHEELEWAKGRMPPLLAEVCDKVKEAVSASLRDAFDAGK
jgi:hypothetical protein